MQSNNGLNRKEKENKRLQNWNAIGKDYDRIFNMNSSNDVRCVECGILCLLFTLSSLLALLVRLL